MPEPTPAPAPTSPDGDLFPSGPWTGFYLYRGQPARHRMELTLTFKNGLVRGDGSDGVGFFLIHGRYCVETLECRWTKTYPGSHDVAYRGFREGKGIWGVWEIRSAGTGGFQIWPKGLGEEVGETLAEEAPAEEELSAIGVGPEGPGAGAGRKAPGGG